MNIPPQPGDAVPALDFRDASDKTTGMLTAQVLLPWAKPIANDIGISPIAVASYGFAAEWIRYHSPQCHIHWTTLAAIAAMETKSGTHHGAQVYPNGDVRPLIRGPLLDGSNGTMIIRDTDQGMLDGNSLFDRALGPFQIIPETWKRYAVSARGLPYADPDNITDAALTAARLLCDVGGDLDTVSGWKKAIFSYNNSTEYFNGVLKRANAYAQHIQW